MRQKDYFTEHARIVRTMQLYRQCEPSLPFSNLERFKEDLEICARREQDLFKFAEIFGIKCLILWYHQEEEAPILLVNEKSRTRLKALWQRQLVTGQTEEEVRAFLKLKE